MKDLRAAIARFGLSDPSLRIGLRGVAKAIGMTAPTSMRELIELPSKIEIHANKVSSGDIVGWYIITLNIDGTWLLKGHEHDKGNILGDNYALAVSVPIQESNLALTWTQSGTLDPGERKDWSQTGASMSIISNWAHLVKKHPTYWHLSTSLNTLEVLEVVLQFVVVGSFIVLTGLMGNWHWERDAIGNVVLVGTP
jgi:hypothetical protein